MPPSVLVQLVNGWGSAPRAEAREDQEPYPDPATVRAGSGAPPYLRPALTDGALRQVADQLHPVFAAPGLRQRVHRVAELLAQTGVRPALSLDGDRPDATWLVDDARHALLAAAALALRHQLAERDPARLGVCSGRRCADAYIDTSPAGHRRFCSVTCQNRARIAAWRQRHASPSPPDPQR
jgi:predicted RNA-binding Zn ribbon-like protein